MDPPRPFAVPSLLAPGAGSATPRAPERRPAIDDNVLAEDASVELIDGHAVALAPAEEAHATQHFDLPKLLGHVLAPGYRGADDLLTRPDAKTNFAPDVSVYPEARDPATGGRQLEELVFEVIDTTPLAEVTAKARKLVARGVRRVFVVDVKDRSVREWSRARDDWDVLASDATLTDRCFATPIPVRALLDAAVARATVARALLAQREPVLVGAVADGEARGQTRGTLLGRRDALRVIAAARGLALAAMHEEALAGCDDAATLDRWLARAATATTADDVFR